MKKHNRIDTKIEGVSRKIEVLNHEKEKLVFLQNHNYGILLDVAGEIGEKYELMFPTIQTLIDNQVEKRPDRMDEKEREVWFASTLSKLTRINSMMTGILSDVKESF